MIQDIAPKVFDNQYKNMAADGSAYIIYASGDEVLLKEDKGELFVPKLHELGGRPFTIVEEADGKGASRWGKLKSNAGWISLDYASRI